MMMCFHVFQKQNNNNIPSIVLQVGFGEGGVYADPTPTFSKSTWRNYIWLKKVSPFVVPKIGHLVPKRKAILVLHLLPNPNFLPLWS